MKYVPLLDVQLRHSYYTDGSCSDFAIALSPATQQLLTNHRCLARVDSDRVRILAPLSEVGVLLIPFSSDLNLRFELSLRNSDFPAFTDMSELTSKSPARFVSPADAHGAEQSLQLDTDPTPSAGSFAAVEIRHPKPAVDAAPTPASYVVAFAARQARWAYYCLTSTNTQADDLHVVDAVPSSATEVLSFSDANRTNLTDNPDPDDATGLQLTRQYPALRCVRFLSDQQIACHQQPRKYLELRLGDERLVGPLPNPSPHSAVGGPLLFRIIKYRTQPLLTQ